MTPETSSEQLYLYVYRLKPGAGPEYDRRHANVWPELLVLIGEAGITDYQIWRHEEIVICRLRARDGLTFATEILAASDVQKRWTESLSDLFESIADEHGEPLWLREVFRFNS